MRNISFQDCVDFQDCFLFDKKFSPFDDVEDFRTYYPRVLLGEIGGLFNLSCKITRSVRTFDDEIQDECADVFIYLLLFGRMLEIHERKDVLGLIAMRWNEPYITTIETEESFYRHCENMLESVLVFLKPQRELFFTDQYFYDLFASIRQISNYKTKLPWQNVMNTFHRDAVYIHTNPDYFTQDGFYKRACRINIDLMLQFTSRIGIELPKKRIDFLNRLKIRQTSFWQLQLQTL